MKVGNIELYMGSPKAGGPDDLQSVIVNFINAAEVRLEIAVQELDDERIARAIIAARQRGIQVWLVIEAHYLRSKTKREKPFEPGGSHEANRRIHDAVLRSNIQVRTDFNPKIFHQKFIVRDRASILTGSTNFTSTGVGSDPKLGANLNHVVIVHDAEIARIYGREFREIRNGRFGKLNEGHDPAPSGVTVSGVPLKVVFAPDHCPEMEIMKQMLKARERIDFAIFTFSQSSGIDDTMIALTNRGLAVRGAVDGLNANQKWAAARPVKNAGAELHRVRKRGNVRKLHHKLMVIDRQVIIAGSFNYTGPANRLNDENILVIGDLGRTGKVTVSRQKKLASYALEEINRIISEHGERMT